MLKETYTSTAKAINRINPEASVVISTPGDGSAEIIKWLDGTPEISRADIDAKIIELEAEWDAQEYARDRAPAYPSVGDQLDMMMKDTRDGTTTHQEACEAVKTKYPKPE